MKKKKMIVSVVVLLVLAAAAALYFIVFRKKNEDAGNGKTAYVEKVSTLTDTGIGGQSRYMGIVESQATKGVEKDSTKKIKERFVEIDDKVKEGDPLFAYDTEDIQLELQQMELELNNMRTGLNSDGAALQDLRNQKAEAQNEDDRLIITANINTLVAQINQSNYDLEVKQMEYDRKKASLDNNIVYSPMNGVIKAINETVDAGGQPDQNTNGQNNAYITIMEEGDFRVKGTVNEEALNSLNTGVPVYIISRTDENKYWTGTIDKINLEPASNEENGGSFGMGGGGEKSSKYNFYVTPDDSEGLVLGQHLYIELNLGQPVGEKVEGELKLPDYYIVEEGDDKYVWKKNSKDRLVKQKLTLGEYDEMSGSYTVEDGLTLDDFIAYPDPDFVEGMKATSNYDEWMEQQGENTEQEGEDGLGEDGFDPEYPEYPDDGEGMDGLEGTDDFEGGDGEGELPEGDPGDGQGLIDEPVTVEE